MTENEDEEQPATTHALVRTNPTGVPFVGRCVLCGAEGLPGGAALDPCPNPRGVGSAEAVVGLVTGDLE